MDLSTIQTYNQLAQEYDEETADFWERFPRTFLDAFIDVAGSKVLDVGSGPGRDGLLLKQAGVDVTCLDASEVMVRMCQEKGLDAVIGDFTHLPFENETFSGVWAYTSLLHVPKSTMPAAMNEIARVLKPGGTFGLGMIEGDAESYRESSGVSMPRWFSFYTKEELESTLQAHGFEILHFEQFKPKSKNYLNFIARKK